MKRIDYYKTVWASLALSTLTLALLLFTGCASTEGGGGSQAAIIGFIEDAAMIGTAEALIEKPAWKPRFEQAHTELTAAIANARFDGATFRQILNQLPIKELKSREARIGITFAELKFVRYGRNVGIDQPDWVKQGMTAVRNGIGLGLGLGLPPVPEKRAGSPTAGLWMRGAAEGVVKGLVPKP
jgi:hypothetical protein